MILILYLGLDIKLLNLNKNFEFSNSLLWEAVLWMFLIFWEKKDLIE